MFAARRLTPVAVAVALAVLVLVPVLAPGAAAQAHVQSMPMFAIGPLPDPPTPYAQRIPPSRYTTPAHAPVSERRPTPLRDCLDRLKHWRHK
jgi:hypothetical protein